MGARGEASLRPQERLRRRAEFQRVFKRGRRREGPLFQLIGLATERDASRLGMTVGRRIGPAVERNRVKRLLREAFRRNKPLLLRPHDVVLVARAGIRGSGYAEVEREYRAAIEQLVRRTERRDARPARPR